MQHYLLHHFLECLLGFLFTKPTSEEVATHSRNFVWSSLLPQGLVTTSVSCAVIKEKFSAALDDLTFNTVVLCVLCRAESFDPEN